MYNYTLHTSKRKSDHHYITEKLATKNNKSTSYFSLIFFASCKMNIYIIHLKHAQTIQFGKLKFKPSYTMQNLGKTDFVQYAPDIENLTSSGWCFVYQGVDTDQERFFSTKIIMFQNVGPRKC